MTELLNEGLNFYEAMLDTLDRTYKMDLERYPGNAQIQAKLYEASVPQTALWATKPVPLLSSRRHGSASVNGQCADSRTAEPRRTICA